MDEKIIMYDSPEAAKKVTVSGWLSADGRFFGKDEHMARYSGCTHRTCECGNVMKRGYTKCPDCIDKANTERFNTLPFEEWDFKKPVCTQDGDTYFFDIETLEEYMFDQEIKEIDLLICEPIRYYHIDTESVTNGEAHEEWEPSAELQKKIDEFNKYLSSLPPHSWMPGKIRTSYTKQTT